MPYSTSPGILTASPGAIDKATLSRLFADGIRSAVYEYDDFISAGADSTGAASIPTGIGFGKLQWRASLANSGTLQLVTTGQDATHWGIVQLETVTNAASVSAMGRFGASVLPMVVGTGQIWKREWLVRSIPTLSDGTHTWAFRCGVLGAAGSAPTDGIYFEYSSASPSSGNWIGRTALSSSYTTASGGATVPVVAATQYRLTVTWDGTTAAFYVDGTLIGASTTNIPTGNVADIAHMIRSAGTLSRTVLLDYFIEQSNWIPYRAP